MSVRGFTVNQLHKRLGKLIEQGEGRRYVAVDKKSFSDNREPDGVCILDVHGMGILACGVADEDGGTKFDSKGREVISRMCVLVGSDRANDRGEIVENHF